MTTTIPPRIPPNVVPPAALPDWELHATEPLTIVTDPPETTTQDCGGTTVQIPLNTNLPGSGNIPDAAFMVSPASKNVVGGAGGAVFGIGGGGDAGSGGMAGIGAITVLLIVYDLVAWGFLVGALWKGLIDWKGNVKQQRRAVEASSDGVEGGDDD